MGCLVIGRFSDWGRLVMGRLVIGTFSAGMFSYGMFSDGTFSDGTFCMGSHFLVIAFNALHSLFSFSSANSQRLSAKPLKFTS